MTRKNLFLVKRAPSVNFPGKGGVEKRKRHTRLNWRRSWRPSYNPGKNANVGGGEKEKESFFSTIESDKQESN